MSDQPNTPDQGAPASEQPKPQPPQASAPSTDQRDAGEAPLGEAGKKALQQEREARQALERKLKPLEDTMARLNGLFGGDKTTEGEDVVKSLQQRLSQMERDNLVNAVARRHGITDEADVAFLRSAHDEDAMSALAARLKTPAAPPPPVTPQPDPGQGDRPPAQSQEDAEYAAFFPDTPK